MRRLTFVLAAGFVLGLVNSALATNQSFGLHCRTKIIRDNETRYENRYYNYNFLMQVVSDSEGYKSESWLKNRPFIVAKPNERYKIILHNPLPIRVAVNLTIDGLNSINGKPCQPESGPKWIIEPYSYVTIRGWQINGQDSRRFYFTSKNASYAKWRSNSWSKDLSVNCGVIGAAYFWNIRDLENYFAQNPVYEYTRKPLPYSKNDWGLRKEAAQCLGDSNRSEERHENKQKAGTGMGERESNPVELVKFDYNTGMYKSRQAVIIYYDFAKETEPQPFLGMEFAPEM